MAKCVACNSEAAYTVKGHLMCHFHGELFPEHTGIEHSDPQCSSCQQPLAVLDWSTTHNMYICYNPKCPLHLRPQGGEKKLLGEPWKPLRKYMKVPA